MGARTFISLGGGGRGVAGGKRAIQKRGVDGDARKPQAVISSTQKQIREYTKEPINNFFRMVSIVFSGDAL